MADSEKALRDRRSAQEAQRKAARDANADIDARLPGGGSVWLGDGPAPVVPGGAAAGLSQ